MSSKKKELKLVANTIRGLAMDGVQAANSGHPGMPMGCADIGAVLWLLFLRHNPKDLKWINRDRFVLSPGHGSIFIYSLLHLSGYDLSIDDLKQFRQWGSKTPGHPEHFHTDGVETTTGPLGQGFANGVGMAIAQKEMEKSLNNFGKRIIDHYIYGIVSDGDLMEGVSYEAASLAGHMKLGNIIYIYDSNSITIEGTTDIAFGEDIKKRFKAQGWHTLSVDGHDVDELEMAIKIAQKEKDKPSLIVAETIIAKGSAGKAGTPDSHGAPLGEEDIRASKEGLKLNPDETFQVSQEIYDIFNSRQEELAEIYDQWQRDLQSLQGDTFHKVWEGHFGGVDTSSLLEKLPGFEVGSSVATRSASGMVLESLFELIPNLIGGSADLAPSNKSFVKGYSESGKKKTGRNLHYGIREHAMGSIMNGIAYYGGFVPYGATFFVFMDYMRPTVRIAALGKLQAIYVFTHDSFHVGEDGPTHQPVEHLAAARAIPNLTMIRPADGPETTAAYVAALENREGPTAIALTRQNLPVIDRGNATASQLNKGAYIIRDCEGDPDIVMLASGSEVSLALESSETLSSQGVKARVVSFPSWELFEKQTSEYKKTILPENTRFAVLEAGLSMGWEKYAGKDGLFITLEHFGASAPASKLAEEFGFTPDAVAAKIIAYLN